jgi:hypothetical protein
MSVWRWVRGLSGDDRSLLAEALVLLICVRVGLHILPLAALRAALGRRASRKAHSVERVTWAVQRAAARVPGASCLVTALAADAMLRRRGHGSVLRIGVRHGARASVDAHAWVECDGGVVIGAVDTLSDYAVMS